MKPSLSIFLSGLILGVLGAVGWMLWPKYEEHLPDEKKVAMEVLIEKQSGPGYFHAAENTAPTQTCRQRMRASGRTLKIAANIRAIRANETTELTPAHTCGGRWANFSP